MVRRLLAVLSSVRTIPSAVRWGRRGHVRCSQPGSCRGGAACRRCADRRSRAASEPLELPADGQGRGLEVDVPPAQAQRLALPQPEREGHAPPSPVWLACGQPDYPLRLIQGQRLDLLRLCERGVHQCRDVAGDVTALDRDLRGARQDPVDLQHCRRCQALGVEVSVEALQMLGREPVEAVPAQSGMMRLRTFGA